MQQKKFHTDFYVEVKMIPKLHLQVFDLHKVIVPLKEFVQPKLWRFSWKNQ